MLRPVICVLARDIHALQERITTLRYRKELQVLAEEPEAVRKYAFPCIVLMILSEWILL